MGVGSSKAKHSSKNLIKEQQDFFGDMPENELCKIAIEENKAANAKLPTVQQGGAVEIDNQKSLNNTLEGYNWHNSATIPIVIGEDFVHDRKIEQNNLFGRKRFSQPNLNEKLGIGLIEKSFEQKDIAEATKLSLESQNVRQSTSNVSQSYAVIKNPQDFPSNFPSK